MPDEEQQNTDIHLLIAGVRPSAFQEGRWTAHAALPEQIRLGTYDTEEAALTEARTYADRVQDTLKRSVTLKRLLERVERTRPN